MYDNLTLDQCILELFNNTSVAAEYIIETGTCELYTYPAYELPVVVTIMKILQDIITITVHTSESK